MPKGTVKRGAKISAFILMVLGFTSAFGASTSNNDLTVSLWVAFVSLAVIILLNLPS